ncbi:MAG: glycosyltransferase family 4 protein [Candidatus Hydrogenedentes bacterium]|nr:glycosyltransferase family 4 protein [Candidatus Hydrogenedentota bacterium]
MTDSYAGRTMKVGILTFACDAGLSGIGQYLIRLLREFPQTAADLQFEVIGFHDELEAFLPAGHPYTTHVVCTLWKNPILNITWQNTVLPALCQKRRYDVLFLPAANRRLPLWLPCPTVGTVHDFSSIHVSGKYDPLRDFYIKQVLPFLIRRLTRVIVVSECTKQDVVQYARCLEERVQVILHGVDHNTFFPRDKEDAQRAVCPKYAIRPPYILYLSRIEHPGKNHTRLIQAFAHLKQRTSLPHQLVLAGCDWTRAEVVHQVCQDMGLGDNVRFTGFVEAQDLPSLYCGAELFVFPSLFEGFGMPIAEAMASGVPVACSNCSSLPEIAGDAAAYFDPGDVTDIANVLLEMIDNQSARERCINSGRARAAQFQWSFAADRTIEELIHAVTESA